MFRRSHARRAAVLLATTMVALGAWNRAGAQGQGAHDYTAADVAFVQGMIMHHAQAVVMSDWAPTHASSPALKTLASRIALSQHDEIAMMQQWLEERHLAVPDPLHMRGDSAHAMHAGSMHDAMHAGAHDSTMHGMSMPGMQTGGMQTGGMQMGGMQMHGDSMPPMPGMLTPAQMRELEAAHGAAFDRLYLTDMIGHHEGALQMVATLFHTPGAGQQADLFGFATDVDAGQRVEIARMQALLNSEF